MSKIRGLTRLSTQIDELHSLVKIRNAISHNSFLIILETKPLDFNQIIEKELERFKARDVDNLLASLPFIKALVKPIAALVGIAPEFSLNKQVDNNKSKVIFQDYPPGSWKPINQQSPSFSFEELTKSLNSFEQFSFASYFGFLADFDERETAGIFIEKICPCGFSNHLTNGLTQYTCWYCGKLN